MSPAVFALIGVAAVAHAAWNLTIKRARTSGARFLWLTFLVGVVILAPFGISSLMQVGPRLGELVLLACGSGILQVAYFLLLQRGYRLGDVSIVYPLARGTGPLLSVVFAVVLFGKRPGVVGILGALVIIAGVVVIGLAGGRARFAHNGVGILYGSLVGVMIAAYTLWDANAVSRQALPPLGYYWIALLLQFIVFTPFALRRSNETIALARSHWPAVLVVGILSPLAYVLVLFAFQLAPVALVAPAREASVVLVALGGWLFFTEPNPAQRIIGAIVVIGGVALLAIA